MYLKLKPSMHLFQTILSTRLGVDSWMCFLRIEDFNVAYYYFNEEHH